ncbi:hypothetical protein AB0E67_27410 [Streptomyces sp. NPDC032161]|uniref:hypothetical protein n=1 Tax=unclassified Streptomyces TaxID=2593676 RepID=UPI0033F876E3
MINPNACRHCGIDQREHMRRWKRPAGWHEWTPPTQGQIKQRMRARRFARISALPPECHATTAESTEWSYACDTPCTTEYCADCGDAECPRWLRVQERLDLQSLARMTARIAKEN